MLTVYGGWTSSCLSALILGGEGGKRLQDSLDPAYKAKAQFLLQLFLLLSVGEADNRRKGEDEEE